MFWDYAFKTTTTFLSCQWLHAISEMQEPYHHNIHITHEYYFSESLNNFDNFVGGVYNLNLALHTHTIAFSHIVVLPHFKKITVNYHLLENINHDILIRKSLHHPAYLSCHFSQLKDGNTTKICYKLFGWSVILSLYVMTISATNVWRYIVLMFKFVTVKTAVPHGSAWWRV